jgi:hypothetical protein
LLRRHARIDIVGQKDGVPNTFPSYVFQKGHFAGFEGKAKPEDPAEAESEFEAAEENRSEDSEQSTSEKSSLNCASYR